MNRLALAVWLLITWVALWGDLTAANIVSGVLVVAVLLIVFPPEQQRSSRLVVRPIAIAKLTWSFLFQVVASNVVLVATIVSRRDKLRTAIIAVPLVSDSEGTLTVVANLTALTPGMTVVEFERDPPLFYVHTLQLSSPDDVRTEVRQLERLVVEAFGSAEAVAAVRAAPLHVADVAEWVVATPDETPDETGDETRDETDDVT